MHKGDIDIRLRGASLSAMDEVQLAEFILACTNLLRARLITIKPTHLVFRPRNLQPESICTSDK